MRHKRLAEEAEIPQGVSVDIAGDMINVKGPKGELKKQFRHPRVRIEKKDSKIAVFAENATKKEKTMIGTFMAHIKKMFKGVVQSHTYRLKMCSAHFPMNVSVSGKDFIIKNFLGEKIPRKLLLREGVKVKVEGAEIVVESIDKDLAGQTAASIEKLTTIRGRDTRVFQDGIYIIDKDGKNMLK